MPDMLLFIAGLCTGLALHLLMVRTLLKPAPTDIPWPAELRESARDHGGSMLMMALAENPDGPAEEACYVMVWPDQAKRAMALFKGLEDPNPDEVTDAA